MVDGECRYYPETVSKVNPETTDLFRQLMSYDSPRPRTTEKDTKVLRWRDLRPALEKALHGHATYVRERTCFHAWRGRCAGAAANANVTSPPPGRSCGPMHIPAPISRAGVRRSGKKPSHRTQARCSRPERWRGPARRGFVRRRRQRAGRSCCVARRDDWRARLVGWGVGVGVVVSARVCIGTVVSLRGWPLCCRTGDARIVCVWFGIGHGCECEHPMARGRVRIRR